MFSRRPCPYKDVPSRFTDKKHLKFMQYFAHLKYTVQSFTNLTSIGNNKMITMED